MYQKNFEKYLDSKEYTSVECDSIYQTLIDMLTANLSTDVFLHVEELLHAEILFKLECGFAAGFTFNHSCHIK